jgi:hypothetical protein
MRNSHHERGAVISRLSSILFLAISVAPLSSCIGASNEAAAETDLPTPGAVEVVQPLILADRARIPEKEPGFVSAKLEANELIIGHDGTLPSFVTGDVLGGTQGGGYLVRVVGAHALDSTHIELETTPASLTDFIAEGHFRVHYDAEAYARELDQYSTRLRELGGKDGERIASHAEALKLNAGAHLELFKISAASLPASCGVGARGTSTLDADAAFSPVLDLEVEIGRKGTLNLVPYLKKLRLVASGRIDVNATLNGTGTIHGACNIDLLDLVGFVPSIPLPDLTFWAGPVPIIVTFALAPRADAEIKMSLTDADVVAEARATVESKAGVDYTDSQWNLIWAPSCTANGAASIGVPGRAKASVKANVGAELQARLYGLIGPNIGVRAFARTRMETVSPYCAYDAWPDCGVDAYAEAEAGVSLGPLHLTFARLPLVNLELLHSYGPRVSGELHDAPGCSPTPR